MRTLPAALAVLLASAPALPLPAWAAKTSEGQTTYWDMMMQAQAARDLAEGSAHMESRNYPNAAREFAKAVIKNPTDALAHRMLGAAQYWLGEVDQAEAEFNESLKLDPKSAQTHVLLGIVYAWRGDEKRAYAAFQEADLLDPRRADIQMNLGSIEEGMGLTPQALDHFRKAVSFDPVHPLYRFQLGSLYRKLGREEEAMESLQAALKLFPMYQDAMLELGSLCERAGRNKDAAEMFRRAMKAKQRDSVARFRFARATLKDGRPAKAREALIDVFHLTPDSQGGLALSVSYGGRGRTPREKEGEGGKEEAPESGQGPEGPLEVLAKNLARLPLDRDAELSVDIVALPKPKLVKASKAESPSRLKDAFERAAGAAAAQPFAARREFKLKSSDAAGRREEVRAIIAGLRETLAKAPQDAEVRLGMNLSFSERPSASSASSEPGRKGKVSYNPHDVGNDMGLWVMGTGWMSLVEEALESGIEPDTADARLLRGVGYAVMGDAARAEDAFRKALEADSKDALAHLGLGVCRIISGDEKGAAASFRRALELDPGNRAAAEGLKWLLTEPAGPG